MRWRELTRKFDLAIVGAGFGGSLMAMIAHQLGLSVVLLERGRHPRMAIGESTTPLSNLLLEKLSATYDLPRLAPLAKWGSWQHAYPQIACGLKRGFTFFHEHGGQLLVAASPHDEIADTHWYRADVDYFLVREAQSLVSTIGTTFGSRCWILEKMLRSSPASQGRSPFCYSRLLIDATGPRGFLHRTLQLGRVYAARNAGHGESLLPLHWRGRAENAGEIPPYPVDDAAVHHVFDGGWVWVLRFNNGVTSAGVAATRRWPRNWRSARVNVHGNGCWSGCRCCSHNSRRRWHASRSGICLKSSFRSRTIVGERWAMLPSAAGFVDPLLSTGFALTLMGIERLALIPRHGSGSVGRQLQEYAEANGKRIASCQPVDWRAVCEHGQLCSVYRRIAFVFCSGQFF